MALLETKLPTPTITYAGGSVVYPVSVKEDGALMFSCTLCVVPIVGIALDCGPADMLCMDCSRAVRDAVNIYDLAQPLVPLCACGEPTKEGVNHRFGDSAYCEVAEVSEPEDDPEQEPEPEVPAPTVKKKKVSRKR